MAKVMNCSLEISEFKLQSHYYVHFQTNSLGKRHEPFYPLLFFYKDSFGIKYLTKVDMSLKTKNPNQSNNTNDYDCILFTGKQVSHPFTFCKLLIDKTCNC